MAYDRVRDVAKMAAVSEAVTIQVMALALVSRLGQFLPHATWVLQLSTWYQTCH